MSVGADGLIAISATDSVDPMSPDDAAMAAATPECRFRMRFYNADGSRGTMCGNGARCTAWYAHLFNHVQAGEETFDFATDAGPYTAHIIEDEIVRLQSPDPRGWKTFQIRGTEVHYIWTGTEHAVVFVSDVDSSEVLQLGKEIRWCNELQPTGANVNFVEVMEELGPMKTVSDEVAAGQSLCHDSTPDGRNGSRARLRIRTFEKGVEDETLACGTGAIAALTVAYLAGKTVSHSADIEARGGTLKVSFRPFQHDGRGCDTPQSKQSNVCLTDVRLEGPATVSFTGTAEMSLTNL